MSGLLRRTDHLRVFDSKTTEADLDALEAEMEAELEDLGGYDSSGDAPDSMSRMTFEELEEFKKSLQNMAQDATDFAIRQKRSSGEGPKPLHRPENRHSQAMKDADVSGSLLLGFDKHSSHTGELSHTLELAMFTDINTRYSTEDCVNGLAKQRDFPLSIIPQCEIDNVLDCVARTCSSPSFIEVRLSAFGTIEQVAKYIERESGVMLHAILMRPTGYIDLLFAANSENSVFIAYRLKTTGRVTINAICDIAKEELTKRRDEMFHRATQVATTQMDSARTNGGPMKEYQHLARLKNTFFVDFRGASISPESETCNLMSIFDADLATTTFATPASYMFFYYTTCQCKLGKPLFDHIYKK